MVGFGAVLPSGLSNRKFQAEERPIKRRSVGVKTGVTRGGLVTSKVPPVFAEKPAVSKQMFGAAGFFPVSD